MITDSYIVKFAIKTHQLMTGTIFFLSIFLLCISPIFVHAETITYNVCENGCEYENIYTMEDAINSLEDLENKDIIININSNFPSSLYLGSEDNMVQSLTINGNNHTINQLETHTVNSEINDLTITPGYAYECFNSQKVSISNSNIGLIAIEFSNSAQLSKEEYNLDEILDIDNISLSNVKVLGLLGNIKIENKNYSNKLIENGGGILNIDSSKISKIISVPLEKSATTNLYNCTFDNLKYNNLTLLQEYTSEFGNFFNNASYNMSYLNYDIYDINISNMGFSGSSTTTVYFDKEIKTKPSDKIKLTEYLDYYTSDKEIDYTIENDAIAKIENKELVGLKEGDTNITVTTDDGHVVYRIKLNVIKETIVEQIEDKTIEIPPAGIKIKLWVLVCGIILFIIVILSSYILIKEKKKK